MMEEFVSAEAIDTSDLRCPQCRSRTFIAYGTSSVARREIWEEGKSVSFEIDASTHAFQLESIECLGCMRRTHIKTVEVSRLESQVYSLRDQVLDLGGEDPLGLGKEN